MHMVAPFVGAWIEIALSEIGTDSDAVAPFVGAWIEIQSVDNAGMDRPGRSVRRSVD